MTTVRKTIVTMVSSQGESAIEETAPLLRNTSHASDRASRQDGAWSFLPIQIKRIPKATLVPLVAMVIVFCGESEFYIKQPAQIRALEAMACLEYYSKINDPIAREGKNIPELLCKVTAVQERVATLYGIHFVIRMMSAVMGTFLLLHVFKAEKKRPVLLLSRGNVVVMNLLMITAYFAYPHVSIYFMCFSGITGIFGGNIDLGLSMIFAAYADVIPDETHRSNLIFITTSLQYASQAICYPVTSYLMNLDGKGGTSKVSFFVALAFAAIAFLSILLFFPETYQAETVKYASEDDGRTGDTEQATAPQQPRIDANSGPAKVKNKVQSISPYQTLRRDFGFARVILLFLATFFGFVGTRVVDWYGLIQYPSIKFHWTLSKTTYLVCMAAILSFINFTLVLPNINKLCRNRFGISARSTSAGIVVTSALILALSTTAFGLPGTTAVAFIIATIFFTLGSGLNSALQAYIVSTASSPRSSGAALTVLSLAATAGKVTASLIWPSALTLGLEHPSGKLGGLPFFVAAILFICTMVVVILTDRLGRPKS